MVSPATPYADIVDVNNAYIAAATAQKNAEIQLPGDDSFGGDSFGGGGGLGGGSVVEVAPSGETATNDKPAIIPNQDFMDLASVSWAEEAILALKNKGIVSGEGDGNFYPDRAITREDFLKMLLQTAAINATDAADVDFGDVEKDAWYYNFVATAYQTGIVKGISEAEFGIGQKITRADMAVMLHRVLNYLAIVPEREKPAFVYNDFDQIPDYAEKSIAILSEEELMNGVGENNFMPAANATRAEAAVAIYRVYNYIGERR